MKVSAGQLDDLPTDRCVSIGDGSAVVLRAGAGAVAYRNACLHNGSSLDSARVHDGRFSCPQHFWQYDRMTGAHLGGRGRLAPCAVEITAGGEVVVEVPDLIPPQSMRERLLAHAREWERGS
ncbi:MAG: Rieske (2Fe-2S) protein [Phycicoccus sp.]